MRDLIILLVHVVCTILRVGRPGGVRAVIAESVLNRHQLLIVNRPRRRAPNLHILDRLIVGFCSLWIQPGGAAYIDRIQAIDISEFPSRDGAPQISAAIFPKTGKQAGSERSDYGIDPSGRRDETA
jgi:hypothetical protein